MTRLRWTTAGALSPSCALTSDAGTSVYLYHVTPASRVDLILREGLRPAIGPRSLRAKEREEAVYLFWDEDGVWDGLWNWLGEKLAEDAEASAAGYAVLEVRVPLAWLGEQACDASYEAVVRRHIEPHRLRFVRSGAVDELHEAELDA